MRTNIGKRMLVMGCCLCLLLSSQTAYASGEASEEPEYTEPASVAETEWPEAEASDPNEEPLEDPFAAAADGDPMALRLSAMQQDGGTATFSQFTPRELHNETLRKGIDVSAWQGSINWPQVAADGVEFAIIRAAGRTYGTGALFKDSYFASNMRGAKAAGLKVGVYIFSQAITVEEAIEEADYLLSLVRGYSIDLPLVFDFEYVSGGRLTSGLGKRLSTDICNAFCKRVEAAGYESMVYGNPSTLGGCLYPKEFGRVWLAHYIKKTTYSASDYEYWQCSGAGTVNGIEGDVDLDFWFEPIQTGMPFTDVKADDWFCSEVKQAYEAKIVSGMTATTFGPGATATRGQVIAMIHRMEGEPAWTVKAAFTDLTHDYYKDAIYWAAEKGIASGYSAESFLPDQAISREELVTILYRLAGKPETSGDLSRFKDASSVQSWAVDAMNWAVQNKIISGYAEDSTVRPQRSASRAEVCAILMRYRAL